MEKWDYLTVSVAWHDKRKEWLYRSSNSNGLSASNDSLAGILKGYGSEGWELATLLPVHQATDDFIELFSEQPAKSAYRVCFKKRLEN